MYYVILDILTGQTLYQGTSIGTAAMALEPGTVYGRDESKAVAMAQAKRRRQAQICKCGA
jgi:hypothetical protein